MYLIKCDKCGVDSTTVDKWHELTFKEKEKWFVVDYKEYVLCSNCFKKFKNWIENG